MLEADRLLVGCAGAPVCGEISVAVGPGEVLGVVGVNGAGKSTVVRTLAGRQPALAWNAPTLGPPQTGRHLRWKHLSDPSPAIRFLPSCTAPT